MSNHTPAPWRFAENSASEEGRRCISIRSCSREKLREIAYIQSSPNERDAAFDYPDETAFANARLIAAAPDLYSVLEAFVDDDDTPDPNCSCHIAPPCADCVEHGHRRDLIQEARNALAKVRGEQ